MQLLIKQLTWRGCEYGDHKHDGDEDQADQQRIAVGLPFTHLSYSLSGQVVSLATIISTFIKMACSARRPQIHHHLQRYTAIFSCHNNGRRGA